MIRRVKKLATALIVAGVVGVPGSAHALPIAQVSDAPLLPVAVGQVVTFDGSTSVCDVAPCRYIWTWFYPSGVTGGQMGEGQVVNYAFPAAAAGRTVAVVIKVVDSTKTHGFDTTTVSVSVLPLDPIPPPPVQLPPPPVQLPPPPVQLPPPPVQLPPPPVIAPPDPTPPLPDPTPPPVVVPPVVSPPVVSPPVVTPPPPPPVTPPTRVRHGGHAGKRGG